MKRFLESFKFLKVTYVTFIWANIYQIFLAIRYSDPMVIQSNKRCFSSCKYLLIRIIFTYVIFTFAYRRGIKPFENSGHSNCRSIIILITVASDFNYIHCEIWECFICNFRKNNINNHKLLILSFPLLSLIILVIWYSYFTHDQNFSYWTVGSVSNLNALYKKKKSGHNQTVGMSGKNQIRGVLILMPALSPMKRYQRKHYSLTQFHLDPFSFMLRWVHYFYKLSPELLNERNNRPSPGNPVLFFTRCM